MEIIWQVKQNCYKIVDQWKRNDLFNVEQHKRLELTKSSGIDVVKTVDKQRKSLLNWRLYLALFLHGINNTLILRLYWI